MGLLLLGHRNPAFAVADLVQSEFVQSAVVLFFVKSKPEIAIS